MSSSSSELIDDADPRVQYQAGWTFEQNVVEVDGTRHGAKTAGLKAWLSFTGESPFYFPPSDLTANISLCGRHRRTCRRHA